MATLAIVNPKKRGKKKARPKVTAKVHKRGKSSRTITIRAKNPKKRGHARRRARRHARRSNPILSGGALTAQLMPALMGAVGAAVVDKAADYVAGYLPVQLRTGWGRYLALGGIALAIGYGLDKAKLVKPATRNALIGGALTVTAYKAVSAELMPMLMPAITTAPAPGVKGYQSATLMGYQAGRPLGEMENNAPVVGYSPSYV